MAVVETIPYKRPASLFADYVQLFFKRRAKAGKSVELPSFALRWQDVGADRAVLAEYRDACGMGDMESLPILYPQVMSLGMQLSILKHPAFPLSPFGAVHQRNHVLQHRAIGDGERFDLECAISGSRVVKQGLEFDINTSVLSGGTALWEGISTYLFRGSRFGEPGPLPIMAHMPEVEKFTEAREWHVAAGMGRRYARISGDYNPIHISSVLARLFKFPRAIVHGMWTAAVCATYVRAPEGPVRYDIAFKGPVFLGSDVTLQLGPWEPGTRFDLFCAGNPRPCLKGWVRQAHAGERLLG